MRKDEVKKVRTVRETDKEWNRLKKEAKKAKVEFSDYIRSKLRKK